jgi:hypothetical protein
MRPARTSRGLFPLKETVVTFSSRRFHYTLLDRSSGPRYAVTRSESEPIYGAPPHSQQLTERQRRSRGGPAAVPRKAGKRRVAKGAEETKRAGQSANSSRPRRSADSAEEFLNRESQVRFLPGALSQSPRSRALSESLNSGSECAFRAAAPHWPRGGQSSDQDVTSTVGLDLDSGSCREVMPARGTSPRATGLRVMFLLALVIQINRTRSFARDRTQLSISWRRRSRLGTYIRAASACPAHKAVGRLSAMSAVISRR